MTIDELAVFIQTTVAKKEDLVGLATKEDLESLATKDDLRALDTTIDAVEQKMDGQFRMVRQEIKMLNFAVERDDLRARMKKVEEKLGLSRAVA